MADEETRTDDKDEGSPARPERRESTRRTTAVGGVPFDYTITAGTLNLKDDKGKDRASVFYVSYVKEGVQDAATRPVTFCFNGGPGSSAVWLQFGAFGPLRIAVPDLTIAEPPPIEVVDNLNGLLDLTDLVFIDPVGTGFSRPIGKTEATAFHSIKDDIESVGELIWRWTSREGRWRSPKLLAGESYGTTRAGGLANWLLDKGIVVSGLVLVSVALSFRTFIFHQQTDLPHVLYLPSYAAVAAYHGRLAEPPADLEAFLAEVRRFAVEEYAPALLWGTSLPVARREQLARQLAAYTGLPAEEILRRNLRIEYLWFARSLLGPGRHTVGRLDARYVGPDPDPHGTQLTRDPSMDAVLGPYTAEVNDVLRRIVGWEVDDEYNVLSLAVNAGWRWGEANDMQPPDTAPQLRQAMLANPRLKVLFMNGLYDLATPFFAAEYTETHLDLPEELRGNARHVYYEAGHMMYLHEPSLVRMREDLVRFYDKVLGG